MFTVHTLRFDLLLHQFEEVVECIKSQASQRTRPLRRATFAQSAMLISLCVPRIVPSHKFVLESFLTTFGAHKAFSKHHNHVMQLVEGKPLPHGSALYPNSFAISAALRACADGAVHEARARNVLGAEHYISAASLVLKVFDDWSANLPKPMALRDKIKFVYRYAMEAFVTCTSSSERHSRALSMMRRVAPWSTYGLKEVDANQGADSAFMERVREVVGTDREFARALNSCYSVALTSCSKLQPSADVEAVG